MEKKEEKEKNISLELVEKIKVALYEDQVFKDSEISLEKLAKN